MSHATGRPDQGPAAAGAADRWVAVVTIAFCIAVFAWTYRFDEVPAALMQGLGAELFPRLVLATMALLAVFIACGVGISALAPPPPIPSMVWVTGGAMLVFMAAIELIGLWPACVLFLVALGRVWGERGLLRLTVSALALTGALYLLFARVLGVTFPMGAIWGAISSLWQ